MRAAVGIVTILSLAAATPAVLAVGYTWSSATTGGLWSGTANWSPNSGANGPTTTDTVLLDTTASGTYRTVTIDSTASTGVGTLTLTQTNSGTNELSINKTFSVTNAITLGASDGGVSRLVIIPTSTSNFSATFTSGISLNAGGVLTLGAFSGTTTTVGFGNLIGNVTVQGGSLIVDQVTKGVTSGSTGSANNTLTGTLTMTSGTFTIVNSTTNQTSADRRLTVTGLNVTGGAVTTTVGGAVLQWNSTGSGTFNPQTFDNTKYQISLGAAGTTGDQTLSLGVQPKIFARGNGVKTLVSTTSGANIRELEISDNFTTTTGTGTIVRLGSDFTLVSGVNLPRSSSTGATPDANKRMDVGIDTTSYTLDLTANSGVFTPNTAFTVGSGSATYWQLSGTAGRIVANGFNFNTNGAPTSVGPGLVLESKSGNGVANDLSINVTGTGAIDPTSIFRYSGNAAAGTPSTLTSNRSIGDVEVQSGALQLSSTVVGMQALRVSGGLLNLGTNSRSVTTATFTGGTVSSGTLTTSAGGYTGGAVAGATATVSAILSGTGALVHSGSGALVLSGANDFAGGATLSAGTVRVGVDGAGTVGAITSGALGTGTLTFAGGGLSSDSTTVRTILNPVTFTGDGVLGDATNSGTLTFAAAADLGAAVRTLTVASPAQFDGAIAGTGGLSKAGAATLTLTASNGYSGGTTISAGTLALGNGGASGSIAGNVTTNATLTFNRSDAVTFGGAIGGTGGVVQSGSGRLTLSASNAYQGGAKVVGTGTLAITNVSALGSGTLTLQTSRADTSAVFTIGASGTVLNPVAIDLSASGRNNIAVTSGSVVLAGPITILGTAARQQNFNSDSTGFEIRGNVSGTAFSSALSFRGSGATGVISGTINVPNAIVEVNNTNAASWRVTSTGNSWATTRIGATGYFIVGANDALATAAPVTWIQTPTGGVDLNGFNQTVAGLDSGTTAAGAGRVTNNSASGDSTLTLASGTANYEFRGLVTDGTNGRRLAVAMNSPGRTQTLSGSNTYSGGTTIVAGTLALGAANALGSTTGSLAVNGGTLDLRGYALTVGLLTGSSGGTITSGTTGSVTLTANAAGAGTYAGTITNGSGTVALAKIGSGTLTLSASNSYTGGTTLNAGMLSFAANALGSGTVTVAGGALQWASGNTQDVSSQLALVSGSTATLDTGVNTVTLAAGFGGATSAALMKAGAGTLVLTGSNSYTGGTTINAGMLQIGNDGASGWIQGDVANNGVLRFKRSDNVTYPGTISGTGSLSKQGAGMLTLTAANTFTGDVTIGNAANSPNYVLRLENSEALGPASAVKSVSNGGGGAVTSMLELANDISIDANKTLFTSGHNYFVAGSSAEGTPVFLRSASGSNAWLGGIVINNSGGGYSIESVGGTLTLGSEGTSSVLKNEFASSTRTFEFRGPGATVVYSRLMGGTTTGAVTGLGMIGTGTLTIARTDNDFTYAPKLSVGTTRVASLADGGATSSLGTGTSFSLGGTLEHLGGANSTSNRSIGIEGAAPAVVASGTGTLALTNAAAIAYQDPTSVLVYTFSSGATTLVGSAVYSMMPGFTLSGTGIAPGTTVTAVNYDTRVITLSQATTASSTSVTLTVGGQNAVARTFVLGGTNTGANTFAPRLVDKDSATGKLSLSKTGAGTWAVTGSNGYTGSTSVTAGTLRIGDGGTAGSIGSTSGIAVAGGALLAFNRTDGYGGAFDRVISGSGGVRVEAGRLNLTGSNTYMGMTAVSGGTLLVNGSLVGDVTVAAGATLGGSGVYGNQISGAGTISVGNSPGIGTAASADPTLGMDWVFEITGTAPTWSQPVGSTNDVLRLTGAAPFTASLTGSNEVAVLFDVTALGGVPQGSYLGGFYSDLTDFSTHVANGTFTYWVSGTYGDTGNQRQFAVGSGGSPVTYSPLAAYDAALGVSVSVVQQSVDFGGGTVDGYATQFVVVPEPAGLALAGLGAAAAAVGLARRRRARRRA